MTRSLALCCMFMVWAYSQAQSWPWPMHAIQSSTLPVDEPTLKSGPAYINASETEGGLLRFWPLSMPGQSSDTSISYAIAVFDTLVGPFTPGVSASALTDAHIDSLGLLMQHSKTSQHPTRWTIEFLSLNGQGYPSGSTWFSDTLEWNSSMAPQAQRIWVPINAAPSPGQPWAVRVSVLNLGLGDTLQLAGRHPIKDTCGTRIQADTSEFYPQSFAYWQGYNLLIPTPAGGDFFTDCNSNGQLDSSDGANPIQTWDMALAITASGLSTPIIQVQQSTLAFPNPCSATMSLGLPAAAWHMYDAFGREVLKGFGLASIACQSLPPGCYTLVVQKENYIGREKVCVH